jgi:hypothetical protein
MNSHSAAATKKKFPILEEDLGLRNKGCALARLLICLVILGRVGAACSAEKLTAVVLKETLRITEQSGTFFFASPEMPHIDDLGFIWVADQDQLLLFSPEGKFIRNFFKKGQGPGELTNVSGFIPERNRVLVFNRYPHKVIAFDRDGRILQETSISQMLGHANLLGSWRGRYYFLREYFQSTGGKAIFLDIPVRLLSAALGEAEARVDGPWFPKRYFVRDTSWIKNVNFVQIAEADETRFLIASNGNYEIHRLDLERMEISSFIRREYRKVKIRPEWKTSRDQFRAPSQTLSGSELKVFEHEMLDDVQKIWVSGDKIWVLTSTFDEANRLARVDLYDLMGKFLGSLMMPLPQGLEWMRLSYAPMTLRDNGLYVLAPAQTEALELVRYSLSGLPDWAR